MSDYNSIISYFPKVLHLTALVYLICYYVTDPITVYLNLSSCGKLLQGSSPMQLPGIGFVEQGETLFRVANNMINIRTNYFVPRKRKNVTVYKQNCELNFILSQMGKIHFLPLLAAVTSFSTSPVVLRIRAPLRLM